MSCSTDKTGYAQDSSLRDSLKTSIISIEVPDFDESIDPVQAQVYLYVWHSQQSNNHQLFLDTDGRASFTITENIARDFTLTYGESFFTVVVRPGEDLLVELRRNRAGGGYELHAPESSFTNQAAEIIAVLEPPIWPTRNSLTKGIDNLDSLFAINEGFAEQRRQRLQKLWTSGKYTDPLLLEYANSYIDNQVRTDLNNKAYGMYLQLQADSILQRYLMPNAGKPFIKPAIFNAKLINDLHYEQIAVTSLANRGLEDLPEEEKDAAYYTESIRLIDSLYDGYLHDLFLTRVYDTHLPVEALPPGLMADAERFVRTTPYPNLSEPLREKISIRKGEVQIADLYEQQLSEIPAGMDNPIPQILAEHAGKVIVLDFWATWCSPCIHEMKQSYPDFMKKYAPEQLAVVFLAQRSPENVWRDQISKLEFSAVHLRTDEMQTGVVNKLFGISGIPHHTIFDQQGKLVKAKTVGPGYGLKKEVDKLLGL